MFLVGGVQPIAVALHLTAHCGVPIMFHDSIENLKADSLTQKMSFFGI